MNTLSDDLKDRLQQSLIIFKNEPERKVEVTGKILEYIDEIKHDLAKTEHMDYYSEDSDILEDGMPQHPLPGQRDSSFDEGDSLLDLSDACTSQKRMQETSTHTSRQKTFTA